ncbi:hypothetical protein, partial [Bacillus altitudinis]|uniref:hypothetical protein n=1 Tax=Bacillus altitudinis TaxID=293387 RepID=UPI001C92EEA5
FGEGGRVGGCEEGGRMEFGLECERIRGIRGRLIKMRYYKGECDLREGFLVLVNDKVWWGKGVCED